MKKLSKTVVFIGLLGVFLLGPLAAQNPLPDRERATGLIPIDAEQMKEIMNTWPRIERVNFNWLGFERINRVRAGKGKALLDPSMIKPVGQETESAVRPFSTPMKTASFNEGLVGDLPVYADNSTLPAFPPIRNQGSLGSCACFATTYYQHSYMRAFQQGLNIRDNDDNTNKYSPKWTYNMLNAGVDGGTYINQNYFLLARHGAVTWAEFPYDSDYLAWCLDTDAWRNALNVRSNTYQYVYYTQTDSGLEVIKELLANGYILVFGTYVNSWNAMVIQDDSSTPDDDPAVGKYVAYWVNGTQGSHAMTIVGYNDAIWTDINGNGTIDPGEKGALRIANSWGTDWNPDDGGFIWLAYDALKSVSGVTGGPSTGRVAAFQGNSAFVSTARDNYSPRMIAEFTVNHAKRSQLELTLGLSDTSSSTPTMLWTSWMLRGMGGAYAFDGTTTAVDGTFVFDFTDLLIAGGDPRRYYLSMKDKTAGDSATLAAYKIIDKTTEPDTEIIYAPDPPLPLIIDNTQVYPYVEYMYLGDAVNEIPSIWNPQVSPTSGTTLDTYTYAIQYIDADGDAPAIKYVYIDGTPHEMILNSGVASNGWYIYQTGLDVGVHNYRFYFEDGRGGSAENPLLSGTISGPVVVIPHTVTTPATPSGEQAAALGASYVYSTGGSACDQGHDIQYRFDWGDGTISDWLAVGVTSAEHTWSVPGSFSVRAQARCAVATEVLSAWSSGLIITVHATLPFSEDFASGAPGWLQRYPTSAGPLWYLSDSSYAGGAPYEARCQKAAVNPGATQLITPAIDTTGLSSVRLSFKHFLDAFEAGAQLKIQTSPDKSTWTDEAWVIDTSASNIGPETVDTTLAHNLGITTTYVAFVVTGNLNQFDYWYIDDITIDANNMDDLVGTWDGQGVYYRNSDTGAWVKLASPADMITTGDLDGDGVDDLVGLWPGQGGIWVKYSSSGAWVRLSSTARYIATGDMNGDGRVDLLGTWDGQGVFYRDSMTGTWVKMASEATMITSGDIDGDGTDDLLGLWPAQGGIWVKYSCTGLWERLSSTAVHIAAGDMNGDGRDDLLGTWDGQGVYYRDSITGAWVKMASPATLITAGDIDGDGTDDLIGIWPTQGGVWVKYSNDGTWERLSSTARDITTGRMRAPGGSGAAASTPLELSQPFGGFEEGPEMAGDVLDLSREGPGGANFRFQEDRKLVPGEEGRNVVRRIPSPGEPGFVAEEQKNIYPAEGVREKREPAIKKKKNKR